MAGGLTTGAAPLGRADHVPTDAELSLARARLYFRSEQILSAGALLTALVIRIRYVDAPIALVVVIALAAPVAVTEWSLRRLTADNLVPHVLGLLALFWAATILIAPLAPFALPLMPFAVLVPLLATGTLFDGGRLRLLIAAGTVVMAAIATLALVASTDVIDAAIPAGTRQSIVISGLALRAVTVSFAVLDANRRRTASLATAAAANAELRASRARLVEVADEERRRLERDLHDGAQQHLVAVSMRLRLLASRQPAAAPELAAITDDVGAALESLRELAHGIYPPLLERRGLADALAASCRRSPVAPRLTTDRIGRYERSIESAIYFCCLEALQNAAKHAGPDATVEVRLAHTADGLLLEVVDDGPGMGGGGDAASGRGLRNMADRLAAVGADLQIGPGPAGGTRIRALVPVGA